MTRYLTKDCECPDIVTGTGQKRPTEPCEHGNRFQTEAELRSPAPSFPTVIGASAPLRRYRKSSEPKRDWSLAQMKVEDEGCVCRVCGASGIERAHILGRKYDQPISPGSKTLLVLPDRIVPLCGESVNRCHQRHDAHELDLLPFLDAAEQTQAVLDAGGIESARRRLAPSAYAQLQNQQNERKELA